MELQDWLDTVLAYLKVIVWPAVVFWGVWMFRKQLRDFIDRVRRAKVPGFELEAAEKVRELSERSETLPELAEAQQVVDEQIADDTNADARMHRAEIMEPETLLGRLLIAWSELEVAANDVAVGRYGRRQRWTSVGQVFVRLRNEGLVSAQTAGTAESLQKLRNDIVHRATETILFPAFVNDFTETTRNLTTILRAVPRVDPGKTVSTEGPREE